jgi:hypothetical protein
VELPAVCRPLRFANREGTPTLWAEVNPNSETKHRVIYLLFTGEEAPEGTRYIGTDFFAHGTIVVHAYIR